MDGSRMPRHSTPTWWVRAGLVALALTGMFPAALRAQTGVGAWYTRDGSMCLETPRRRLEQRAGGQGVLVRGGEPVMLTGTGLGPRRSVVPILQDATKPRSTPAHDWTPRNLCGSTGGA